MRGRRGVREFTETAGRTASLVFASSPKYQMGGKNWPCTSYAGRTCGNSRTRWRRRRDAARATLIPRIVPKRARGRASRRSRWTNTGASRAILMRLLPTRTVSRGRFEKHPWRLLKATQQPSPAAGSSVAVADRRGPRARRDKAAAAPRRWGGRAAARDALGDPRGGAPPRLPGGATRATGRRSRRRRKRGAASMIKEPEPEPARAPLPGAPPPTTTAPAPPPRRARGEGTLLAMDR